MLYIPRSSVLVFVSDLSPPPHTCTYTPLCFTRRYTCIQVCVCESAWKKFTAHSESRYKPLLYRYKTLLYGVPMCAHHTRMLHVREPLRNTAGVAWERLRRAREIPISLAFLLFVDRSLIKKFPATACEMRVKNRIHQIDIRFFFRLTHAHTHTLMYTLYGTTHAYAYCACDRGQPYAYIVAKSKLFSSGTPKT